MSETKLEEIATGTGAAIGYSAASGIISTAAVAITTAESAATFGGVATGVFSAFANPVSIPAWAAIVATPAGPIVLGAGLVVGGAYLGKKLGKWLNS